MPRTINLPDVARWIDAPRVADTEGLFHHLVRLLGAFVNYLCGKLPDELRWVVGRNRSQSFESLVTPNVPQRLHRRLWRL
ncbi:MAG: hypothetical protein ACYC35_20295 [Pirellulales bacterium]